MEAIKLFAKWNRTEIDYSMLHTLGIKEIEKKQYARLSTGQKRRLHLALALISNPDIIFLDEPTAGLDVEGRLSTCGNVPLRETCPRTAREFHFMSKSESSNHKEKQLFWQAMIWRR